MASPSKPRSSDDEEGPWPGELAWWPDKQTAHVPDVEHTDPEVAGELELPDGTIITVYYERPSFGYGRWLD